MWKWNGIKMNPETDLWSEWLLHHRHADDPAYDRIIRTSIEQFADRVLDAAELTQGMTLADIGTGDGLVAFRAIDRVGPSLKVLLTDISAPLLRHAETLAGQRNVQGQCTFLECPADRLQAIPDSSVDVDTTRAVLAYVSDKPAALSEFYRILKPGGRISIAEPILQDEALKVCVLKKYIEFTPAESRDRFLTLLHRWQSAQYPDTDEALAKTPITNYTERDLLRFAHNAGFSELHMEFRIDVIPSDITSWEVYIGTTPHPLAPPLRVIMNEQFTPEDRAFFEQTLRPTVEAGHSISTDRIVYLTAKKPKNL